MSRSVSGMNRQRFAEAIALLMKQPRSAPQLREAMGIKNDDQAHGYIAALRGEGLLYVKEWRRQVPGPMVAVYGWQPMVCFHEDASKPPPKIKRPVSRAKHSPEYRESFSVFRSRYIPQENSILGRMIQHMREQGRGESFACFELAAAMGVQTKTIWSLLIRPRRHGLVQRMGGHKNARYQLVWNTVAAPAQPVMWRAQQETA